MEQDNTLLSLFCFLEKRIKLQNFRPFFLAIDGKCGSGKTTLAQRIAASFPAEIVHMDDFFLPPQLRTPERLAEPGGNIHYERFILEVLEPCSHALGPYLCSYRPFECKNMEYSSKPRLVHNRPLLIIEGSYSMRPDFQPYYHASIYLDCSYSLQAYRLKNRNPERYPDFVARWIPMENLYFNTFRIRQRCTFRLSSEELIDTSRLI